VVWRPIGVQNAGYPLPLPSPAHAKNTAPIRRASLILEKPAIPDIFRPKADSVSETDVSGFWAEMSGRCRVFLKEPDHLTAGADQIRLRFSPILTILRISLWPPCSLCASFAVTISVVVQASSCSSVFWEACVAWTGQHRKARILWKAWIAGRKQAAVEDRAPVRADLVDVGATGAEARRWVDTRHCRPSAALKDSSVSRRAMLCAVGGDNRLSPAPAHLRCRQQAPACRD
jgi:hypothetical protein